ncbi:SET domain-containing protein [Xylaria curta]|nr:SET domain-containing protein [Xylaria curta]
MPTNEGVEVKQSPGAGKGLFARNAFSPGDTVVAVDRPLVTELEMDRMLDTCAWCCQRGATNPIEKMNSAAMGLPTGFTEIKGCTGCQRVGYCSKACQSKAWKREHKYECKVIGVKDRPDLPPGVRGVIKILGRLKANPKGEIEHVQDILNLWPAGDPKGLDKIITQDKKRFEDFNFLGRAAWHYCGSPTIDGLKEAQYTSIGLLSNIMNDAFTLSSPLDDIEIGIGFDPLICSANHSCDPNATLVFNQPGQEIRALRAINPGEEIFIRYIEVTNPLSVRQAELKERYFFTCQCTKCQKDVGLEADQFLKPPQDLKSEDHNLAGTLVRTASNFLVGSSDSRQVAAIQADAYAVLENKQATIDEVKKAIKMCIDSKLWPWTRQPVPQLCRRLFALSLESGDVYMAFLVGIKLHCEILPPLYPQEFYPDRLINAWVVSTVINVLCGPAHQTFQEECAQRGLEPRIVYLGFLFYLHEHTPQMFGPKTPFGKVVQSTYEQIMAGIPIPEAAIKSNISVAWTALETLSKSVDTSSLV